LNKIKIESTLNQIVFQNHIIAIQNKFKFYFLNIKFLAKVDS
jgi:hypothetical protein